MTTWKLVPTEPISAMLSAMSCSKARDAEGEFPMLLDMIDYSGENKTHTVLAAAYRAAIAASPEPPHISMTREEAAVFQDWKGMDGAIAFHLIERHANGWGDTQRMMEAWLNANAAPSNAGDKL